jgi:arylsulfatase A-like enzyme
MPNKVEPKTPETQSEKPNVIYFLVDNLGVGELSSYSGGPLRGTVGLCKRTTTIGSASTGVEPGS